MKIRGVGERLLIEGPTPRLLHRVITMTWAPKMLRFFSLPSMGLCGIMSPTQMEPVNTER